MSNKNTGTKPHYAGKYPEIQMEVTNLDDSIFNQVDPEYLPVIVEEIPEPAPVWELVPIEKSDQEPSIYLEIVEYIFQGIIDIGSQAVIFTATTAIHIVVSVVRWSIWSVATAFDNLRQPPTPRYRHRRHPRHSRSRTKINVEVNVEGDVDVDVDVKINFH